MNLGIVGWLRVVCGKTLRRQLMLGIILVHAVLMTLFVFDLVGRQRGFLMEQSLVQARSLAETLAANSVSWTLANDVSGLQEVIRSQARFPHLRYAMLLSPQGRVLGHSDPALAGWYVNDPVSGKLLGAPSKTQILVDDGWLVDVAEPVFAHDKLIGWARVGISQAHITSGLAAVTRNGLLYTAAAIGVGALFAWLMARRLAGALSELAAVAAQVRRGHADRRVKFDRCDELGILANGFNRMLDALDEQAAAREAAQRQLALGKAEMEALFRAIPDAVIHTDSERRIVMVNPATRQLFGYDETELLGKTADPLYPSDRDYRTAVQESDALIAGGNPSQGLEVNYRRKDGSQFFGQLARAVVRNAAGAQIGFISLIRDITRQKEAALQLRLAAQVFENSNEGIVVTDPERRIVMANRAFSEITGYRLEEAVGQTPHLLNSGRHDANFFQIFWESLQLNGGWSGEIWNRRKNGEIYPEWLSVSTVRNEAGQIVNYVGMFSDITERKAAAARIEHLAHHDALTNLPNRLLLHDRIRQAIAQAQRSRDLVAVLFIDLDRFKIVNDSLGHQAGDELLVGVSGRLRRCVREGDTVSRLGGDEFVILLNSVDDARTAGVVAQKVLDTMHGHFLIEQHDIAISPSIGISLYPQDGANAETLIKNADAAMYHAKNLGRNNYQFYTQELNAQTLLTLSLESGLRRALERGELLLHYQPQISLRSGQVVAVEALIRWRHPEQGMIPPGSFIPLAEESGLIIAIGTWVLREACRQNKAWQDAGLPRIPVAVNISALQFNHRDFLASLEQALQSCNLAAHCLELELTESALMHDAEAKLDMLHGIRELGVTLAVDDFGTGYSSLSYLKRLPIDKLKIDKSFVRDIITDPEDAAIVSAIIGMARSLHLKTVAEGVETQEQRDRLKALNCDELQGYYYSRPLPPEECATLLAGGGGFHEMVKGGLGVSTP